jgi:hypothetical protein
MAKWGIWTRTGSGDEWERMTLFGKELSFDSETEAREFADKLRSYWVGLRFSYEYEVREVSG